MSVADRTITLTIDGVRVDAPQGSTVLEAAQRAGIRIPVLCHMDGFPPLTTCFVCVVRVQGRRGFLPACAARVAEGMVVESASSEVHSARRTALELLLSDHVGECDAPCMLACPAGLDVPKMLAAVQSGAPETACEAVWSAFPFPGVLGRICPAYCEKACRRRSVDAAVAIRAVERRVGGQSGGQAVPAVPLSGRRVAVVGAGPAGLTSAWFLQRAGHACTVFEAEPSAGGLLRFVVPRFRLPRDVLDADIARLANVGVEFRFGRRIDGIDALADLRRQYDAVVLALGTQPGPTETLADGTTTGAESAHEFLRRIESGDGGVDPDLAGKSVVVAGHGSEAVSAARYLVRLGAGEVRLLSERVRKKMAAFPGQIEGALADGVDLVEDTRILAVSNVASGQFRIDVRTGEGGEKQWITDRLVLAPERQPTLSVAERLGLPVDSGCVRAAAKTGETPLAGVFAAGEMVSGAGAAVRAVAAGRAVAAAVNQFLRGRAVTGLPRRYQHRLGRLSEDERNELRRGAAPQGRVTMPTAAWSADHPMAEVESALTPAQAEGEAARCLQCACGKRSNCDLRNLAEEYDAQCGSFGGERRSFSRDLSHPKIAWEPGKCVLCGRCTAIAEAAGERPGLAMVRRGFQARVEVPLGAPLAEALSEETARRCVECCPTGALAWQARPAFEESGGA